MLMMMSLQQSAPSSVRLSTPSLTNAFAMTLASVCSVAFRLRIHSLFAIQQHSPVKPLDEPTCQPERISDSQPKYCYKTKRHFISYEVETDEQNRMQWKYYEQIVQLELCYKANRYFYDLHRYHHDDGPKQYANQRTISLPSIEHAAKMRVKMYFFEKCWTVEMLCVCEHTHFVSALSIK